MQYNQLLSPPAIKSVRDRWILHKDGCIEEAIHCGAQKVLGGQKKNDKQITCVLGNTINHSRIQIPYHF